MECLSARVVELLRLGSRTLYTVAQVTLTKVWNMYTASLLVLPDPIAPTPNRSRITLCKLRRRRIDPDLAFMFFLL